MDLKNILKESDTERNINGNSKKALEILEKVDFSKILNLEEKCEYLLKLGALQRDNGSYSNSESTYKKGVSIALKESLKYYELDFYRSLLFLYLQQKDRQKSLVIITKCKNILKTVRKDIASSEIKNQKILANTYAVIGNYYFLNKQYKLSEQNYLIGFSYAKKTQFIERRTTILNDLANVYISQKQFIKAEKVLKKQLQIAKKLYKITVPQVYLRLSRLYVEKNEYKKAIYYAKKSMFLAEKENWQRDFAESTEQIYRILQNKNDPNSVIYKDLANDKYIELGLVNRVIS